MAKKLVKLQSKSGKPRKVSNSDPLGRHILHRTKILRIFEQFDFDKAFALETLIHGKSVYSSKESMMQEAKKMLEDSVLEGGEIDFYTAGHFMVILENPELKIFSLNYIPIFESSLPK